MAAEAAPSKFAIEITRSGNAALVRCSGKLVAGVTHVLLEEVKNLLPDSKHIVLDLTDLTHMDSMGVGTVARLYVSARSAGSKLELINLGKRIRELLGITNLLGVFETCGEGRMKLP
jgi:anti-anti-sigma factor